MFPDLKKGLLVGMNPGFAVLVGAVLSTHKSAGFSLMTSTFMFNSFHHKD